jgi:hypothetical protein
MVASGVLPAGVGVLEAAVKTLGSGIRRDDVAAASNEGVPELQLHAEGAGLGKKRLK